MKGTVSVKRAVMIGRLWVNGPVFLLIVAPIAWTLAAPDDSALERTGFYLCGAGWLLAWVWWSFAVPKWRLWAYDRVIDVTELKRSAISAGLTWPDGSIFARTEIKSKAHAQRERELELRAEQEQLDP